MEYILIVIVLWAIFVSWTRTASGKGKIGEFRVKRQLGKTKIGKKYVINDLMLLEDGKSSQIDHILINKNGVFVIETKNYSGRIYGKENQLEWTQVLNYGKTKNKLYNPVKQNATHIFRVKNFLPQNIPIYSIIVFVQNNCQYIEAENVIPISSLKKTIQCKNQYKISKEVMQIAYDKLIAIKSQKVTSVKQHVQNIITMKDNIAKDICPRCGGTLMKKQGKYGSFFGCENYPKCKFIRKQ